MNNPIPKKPFRLRSFVRRDSRMTEAQERAYKTLWPQFGLNLEDGLLDIKTAFNRTVPTFLEIGFGSGTSLLALATLHPDKNFIGVETHRPGIGALLLGIQEKGITNLRIYYGDVIDILEKAIPPASLEGVQIFFPDPWQKRRHHPRRLIQSEFISQIVSTLLPNGSVHLATDWDDYAKHMMSVLSQEKQLINLAGAHQFSARSARRPVVTKFELRSQREGRLVWELQFAKR